MYWGPLAKQPGDPDGAKTESFLMSPGTTKVKPKLSLETVGKGKCWFKGQDLVAELSESAGRSQLVNIWNILKSRGGGKKSHWVRLPRGLLKERTA